MATQRFATPARQSSAICSFLVAPRRQTPAYHHLALYAFNGKVQSCCFGVGASYRNKFRRRPLTPYSSAAGFVTMSLLPTFIHGTFDGLLGASNSGMAARLFTRRVAARLQFPPAPAPRLLRSCSASVWLRPRSERGVCFACSMITWASAFAFQLVGRALAFAGQDPYIARWQKRDRQQFLSDVSRWLPLTAAIRTSCKTRQRE